MLPVTRHGWTIPPPKMLPKLFRSNTKRALNTQETGSM